MRHLSERELQLPDMVIDELMKLAVEDKNTISLGPGEPDFPAPKPIIEETKRLAGKVNHYAPPGGLIQLREAIAKKLKKENRISADPKNIVVTNGSQEALMLGMAASTDVSEEVIIPNPAYKDYLPMIELFNAVPVFIELKEENGFEIDPDALKRLITKKTSALIINTPANPTGNVLSRKTLEEIADIAVENNLYIFSDEAYEKLIYGNAKHTSIGSFNGMEDYVATTHTFSKSYAMCGYHVGYIHAPSEIADAIRKMHVFTTISAPTISQHLAIKALQMPAKYTETMRKEYDRRRKFIVSRLNEMGLRTIEPQGAFYTFSKIPHNNSLEFSKELLRKAKVAVVPGVEFGRFGEGYIRCSYATKMSLIEEAMNRIEKFLSKQI